MYPRFLLLYYSGQNLLSKLTSKEDDSPQNLFTAIIKALDKHPNVFDAKIPSDKEMIGLMPSITGILVHGPLFSLRVNLPERLQKYRTHYILSHISAYFEGMVKSETQIPEALLSSLKYYEELLHTFGSRRLALVASLIGAAVGAILTDL